MNRHWHIKPLRRVLGWLVAALLVAAPLGTGLAVEDVGKVAPSGAPLEGSREQILKAHANLPLAFVENRGQTDTRVRYYAQGSRYAFYLTHEEIVLVFVKGDASSDARGSTLGAPGLAPRTGATTVAADTPATRGVTLALRFLGGNPRVAVEAEERVPGEVNYFRGNDPARWHTHLPRYAQVVYCELWPGVDLILRGQAGELKYAFRVRPGARLTDIRLAYAGAAGLVLDGAGGLLIETALGRLRDSPPVAYHEIAGARVPVESRYVLQGEGGAEGAYGFAVGAGYQPDSELIIDPGLAYSTFLGGSSDDFGAGIAIDAAGNAYVVGSTQSVDFPTTPGAFDRTLAGPTNNPDVFVSKLNATGSALIYATYLGGGAVDFGRAIAVDGAGNAYVTGQTASPDFPTTGGAFQTAIRFIPTPRPPDPMDAFVTKLNAAGSGLIYSTFLGGTDIDDALGIAVDAAGNAYVTGQTASRDFPTTPGALETIPAGGTDAFVTKLNATGSALVYSTYLGGLDNDLGTRVRIDATNNAYVMGSTRSVDFPTTPGAFDTAHRGGFDVFVAKLNATGSALVYSTYLGGLDNDFGQGLAIDTAGNAYVTGGTLSIDFPTTPGAFSTALNGSDAFVTKINATGSALVYSTFLGGSAGDGASAIAVDGAGTVWVTGGTSSADFPITPDGFDTSFNGTSDVFVSHLNATGSALVYSTFLGGTNSENGNDLALDAAGNVYVTGKTMSADFPTTPGVLDTVWNGDPLIFWGDGFVTKLGAGPAPSAPTLSALSVSPTSVTGGSTSQGTVTLSAVAPTGGSTVTLSSNNAVATVPGSATVAAGATSATFTVTTTAVTASTAVTISGSFGGTSRTATLTVTPAATGTLPAPTLVSPAADARFSPGLAIPFDWSDVAGAASYTIQIDDSNTFTTPLIVSQSVTVSQYTNSTLPTRQLWWRVRATDSAGNAGAWSAVRRFEVKN